MFNLLRRVVFVRGGFLVLRFFFGFALALVEYSVFVFSRGRYGRAFVEFLLVYRYRGYGLRFFVFL